MLATSTPHRNGSRPKAMFVESELFGCFCCQSFVFCVFSACGTDGKIQQTPTGLHNAPHLIHDTYESSADIGHVGKAKSGEYFARSSGTNASLTTDHKFGFFGQVGFNNFLKFVVGHHSHAWQEVHNWNINRTDWMPLLKFGNRTNVEINHPGITLQLGESFIGTNFFHLPADVL